MTVDPRLQLTPGEYLIHPDGSASKVVDRRNLTVDEILACGRYTDRRGRRWTRSNYGMWMHPVAFHPVLGVRSETRQLSEMRLLIERDMHRDECEGAWLCTEHPVPFVYFACSGVWAIAVGPGPIKHTYDTLPEAMGAACELAVTGD